MAPACSIGKRANPVHRTRDFRKARILGPSDAFHRGKRLGKSGGIRPRVVLHQCRLLGGFPLGSLKKKKRSLRLWLREDPTGFATLYDAHRLADHLTQLGGGGKLPKSSSAISPIASKSRSWPSGPSNSIPTGRPVAVNPMGMLSPGNPAAAAGRVLRP